MKNLGLHEISFDRKIRGGIFPFKFSWQARTGPIRVGVGLEIADMGHRLDRIDRSKPGQSEIPPFAISLDPIEWGIPVLFVHRSPA